MMMMALLSDDDGAARSVYSCMLIVITLLLTAECSRDHDSGDRDNTSGCRAHDCCDRAHTYSARVCVTIGLITGQIMDSGIMIWVTSCNCKMNAYDYGEQGPAGCDHISSERTCRSYG